MPKAKKKRIYYSHAMPTYGTKAEAIEKKHIKRNFPGTIIVDPGSLQDNPNKLIGGMEYCLSLVEECEILVFSQYANKITAGVGKEVNHALKNGIRVYKLKNGKIKLVKKPIRYLSRANTILLYNQ